MVQPTLSAKELIEKYQAGQRDFSKLDLSGVELSWQNLPGILLQGSDLYGAKLAGTVLTHADLTGANLAHADLGRAELTGANLAGADLRGANLRDAISSGALCDALTQFPIGFSPESSGIFRPQPAAPFQSTQVATAAVAIEQHPTQVVIPSPVPSPQSANNTVIAPPAVTSVPAASNASANAVGIAIGTALGVGMGLVAFLMVFHQSQTQTANEIQDPAPESTFSPAPTDNLPTQAQEPNVREVPPAPSPPVSVESPVVRYIPPAPAPIPSPPPRQAYRSLGFSPTCGSPPGHGTWWPVRGAVSSLGPAQQICGDSYIRSGETQVASFTSRGEAAAFASQLSAQTGQSFWVGEPTQR
jgi:hypothetical protein